MHQVTGPGYGQAVSVDEHIQRPAHPPVTSRRELVEVLRLQHEELRTQLDRLADLSGQARDDEFLQARRRLAAHQALEAALLSPLPAEDHLHVEVLTAEQHDPGGPAFTDAVKRVLATLDEHVEDVERAVVSEQDRALGEAERRAAASGLALWEGEGEVHLGGSFHYMLTSARSALAQAVEEGPVPRP